MTGFPTDRPDVSVVIPTRNRRALLDAAIGSVWNQTGVTREIIVVDDASDDDTWAFLSAQQDVRSFRQDSRGERSRARNTGLSHAAGRYVMFFDDDDLLQPGGLALLARALDKHPDAVGSVGARLDWFVDEGWQLRDSHPRFARKLQVFDYFLFGWAAASGQALYRTDIVRNVGGYDPTLTWCEDRDLWLRLSLVGPMVVRPEVVTTYRIARERTWPSNVREIRQHVALRAIRKLPREARRPALVIRKCSRLIQEAEDQMRDGHPLRSIASATRAAALDPRFMFTPLIGSLVARRLARGAAHSIFRSR